MITAAGFEDVLCHFLQKEVAETIVLETKKHTFKVPQVVKGFILPKESGDDTAEFP